MKPCLTSTDVAATIDHPSEPLVVERTRHLIEPEELRLRCPDTAEVTQDLELKTIRTIKFN